MTPEGGAVLFADRRDAGRRLAARLAPLAAERGVVVVGLPRGGVPVASEVAMVLHAPLDVIVIRKLGVPFQPELAMGAIGEDGVRVLDDDVIRAARVSADDIATVERREQAELARRVRRFRGTRPRVELGDRTVVVVDDGIATGSTARAACQVARAHGAGKIILAVPVAPAGWTDRFADVADEMICLESPAHFSAVGEAYADFGQTSDDEVVELLDRGDPGYDAEVVLTAVESGLVGHLSVPPTARGVVVFAHGSGSSRHSPRNHFVADALHRAGIGTLLFDLLTTQEEVDRRNVFDIDLLAGRLLAATRWLREQARAEGLPIGYFGASTGAAAALVAASEPSCDVVAIVSRGGRPDLAGERLSHVRAPTLLIVGGEDREVIELNRDAQRELRCEHRLAIVPGATHLFVEHGALELVADLACGWFVSHLHKPNSRIAVSG